MATLLPTDLTLVQPLVREPDDCPWEAASPSLQQWSCCPLIWLPGQPDCQGQCVPSGEAVGCSSVTHVDRAAARLVPVYWCSQGFLLKTVKGIFLELYETARENCIAVTSNKLWFLTVTMYLTASPIPLLAYPIHLHSALICLPPLLSVLLSCTILSSNLNILPTQWLFPSPPGMRCLCFALHKM